MDDARGASRAARIVVRRFESAAEADRHDVEYWIGREAFIKNKRATGRAKDLGDIEGIEDADPR